jgi:geranylgeranylglycerol-phosphate geranylgeranyltransferase
MHSASAALALIRWPNALIAAAGVFAGAWWVRGDLLHLPTVLAAGAAIALTAVANAYNDITDIDIDRTAHPRRPLPSRALSVATAMNIVRGAAILAVLLATAARPALGALTICVIVAMVAYSRDLKRRGFAGNATVALLASLPFLYGAWTGGAPWGALPLLAVAIPLHFAREIAKDIEDAHADLLVRRTIPLVYERRAVNVLLVSAVLLSAVAAIPLLRAAPLLTIALLPAALVTGIAVRRTLARRSGAGTLFKSAMVLAMASLLLARPVAAP